MRKLLVLGALAAATAAPAIAQEVTISGNVALTSDYQWRNRTQSTQDMAIQGGFDIATESGFYVGTWASSLGSNAGPSIELDVYAGYGFEALGLGWDVGAIYYAYPDEDVADLDFWEIYVGISKEFEGGIGLGGSLNFDPDNETVYADASISYALSDALSFSGGYGAYIEEGDFAGIDDWTGFNAGATWAVAGVDLDFRYYSNEIDTGDFEDNFVFTIGKAL
jgi:uncharacterized protein (TIGR02001 family)